MIVSRFPGRVDEAVSSTEKVGKRRKRKKKKRRSYDYSQRPQSCLDSFDHRGKRKTIDHTKYAKFEALVHATERPTHLPRARKRREGKEGEESAKKSANLVARNSYIGIPLTAVVLCRLPCFSRRASSSPKCITTTPHRIDRHPTTSNRFRSLSRDSDGPWCIAAAVRFITSLRRRDGTSSSGTASTELGRHPTSHGTHRRRAWPRRCRWRQRLTLRRRCRGLVRCSALR